MLALETLRVDQLDQEVGGLKKRWASSGYIHLSIEEWVVIFMTNAGICGIDNDYFPYDLELGNIDLKGVQWTWKGISPQIMNLWFFFTPGISGDITGSIQEMDLLCEPA